MQGDEKRARVEESSDSPTHWFSVLIPDDCFYRIAAYLVVDDLFAASHTSRAYAASLTPAVLPSLLEPQLPGVAATAATASPAGSWVNYPKGACEVDSGPRVAIGNQRLEFLCRKFPGCATLRLPAVCSKLSVDGVAAALRSLPSLTDLEVHRVQWQGRSTATRLGVIRKAKPPLRTLFPDAHHLQRLRVTGTVFLGADDLAGLVASPHLSLLELRGLRLLSDIGLHQLLSRQPSTAPPPPVPIGLPPGSVLPTAPPILPLPAQPNADAAAANANANANATTPAGTAGTATANTHDDATIQLFAAAAAADVTAGTLTTERAPGGATPEAHLTAIDAALDGTGNSVGSNINSSTGLSALSGSSSNSNVSISSSSSSSSNSTLSSPLGADASELSPPATAINATNTTAATPHQPPPPPLPLGLEELLLSDCTNLRALNFPCAYLQRLELKHCVNLASFQMACLPQLLDVDMQFCTGLQDPGVEQLLSLAPQLRRLCLKGCARLQNPVLASKSLHWLDASLCSGLCVPTVKCPSLRTLQMGMCVGLRHARLWVPHLASLDLRNLPLEGLALQLDPSRFQHLDLSGCHRLDSRKLRLLLLPMSLLVQPQGGDESGGGVTGTSNGAELNGYLCSSPTAVTAARPAAPSLAHSARAAAAGAVAAATMNASIANAAIVASASASPAGAPPSPYQDNANLQAHLKFRAMRDAAPLAFSSLGPRRLSGDNLDSAWASSNINSGNNDSSSSGNHSSSSLLSSPATAPTRPAQATGVTRDGNSASVGGSAGWQEMGAWASAQQQLALGPCTASAWGDSDFAPSFLAGHSQGTGEGGEGGDGQGEGLGLGGGGGGDLPGEGLGVAGGFGLALEGIGAAGAAHGILEGAGMAGDGNNTGNTTLYVSAGSHATLAQGFTDGSSGSGSTSSSDNGDNSGGVSGPVDVYASLWQHQHQQQQQPQLALLGDFDVVICGTPLTVEDFPFVHPSRVKRGGEPLQWGAL